MNVDPIGFLPASASIQATRLPALADAGPAAPGARSFVDWMSALGASTGGRLARAEDGLQALASGENVSLHHVMIDLEEARLSFQLMAQVRNRLVESYQEVMRMQI